MDCCLGPVSIKRPSYLRMAISMLKIRRPLGRLIFNMGIAIPGKTVFLIETAPWWHQAITWTNLDSSSVQFLEFILAGFHWKPRCLSLIKVWKLLIWNYCESPRGQWVNAVLVSYNMVMEATTSRLWWAWRGSTGWWSETCLFAQGQRQRAATHLWCWGVISPREILWDNSINCNPSTDK